MIRAIVVDDEKQARRILTSLLTEFIDGVEVVGQAKDVAEAIELIHHLNPDIVFLDIEMPNGNGFSLFDQFDEFTFEVIFTTAYSEYALKAIKHSALDYLLKPVDVEELKKSIEKFKQQHQQEENIENKAFLLPESLNDLYKQTSKIVLPIPKGFKIIQIKEILYCKASGSYSEFYLVDGKCIVVGKILKYFEEKLAEFNLLRIHDSYLINLAHLDSYVRGRGGKVIMNNGIELDVSRSRKEKLLEKLND